MREAKRPQNKPTFKNNQSLRGGLKQVRLFCLLLSMIPSEFIKTTAKRIGFDDCGIALSRPLPFFHHQLTQWLKDGNHGTMSYLEQNIEKRTNPQQLLQGAKSIISVLVAYRPDKLMENSNKIALYAYGEDYHRRIKKMLFQLIEAIKKRYPDFEAKPCVDTVPISDKLWAMQAGLGWIGKHTLLVHPQLGSWLNIGELVTPSEVDVYDSPISNGCLQCQACINACPNQALSIVEGRAQLNATLCTSYNTIENQPSPLPDSLHTQGYVFGCDICQSVCPFNKRSPVSIVISPERMHALNALANTDETTFKKSIRHTAMDRIKFAQWQRNLQHNKDSQETDE